MKINLAKTKFHRLFLVLFIWLNEIKIELYILDSLKIVDNEIKLTKMETNIIIFLYKK